MCGEKSARVSSGCACVCAGGPYHTQHGTTVRKTAKPSMRWSNWVWPVIQKFDGLWDRTVRPYHKTTDAHAPDTGYRHRSMSNRAPFARLPQVLNILSQNDHTSSYEVRRLRIANLSEHVPWLQAWVVPSCVRVAHSPKHCYQLAGRTCTQKET